MMYGHYLQMKGLHMGNFCVATSILRRDHGAFFQEIEQRWERVEAKRKASSIETAILSKKARALAGDGSDWSAAETDMESTRGGSVIMFPAISTPSRGSLTSLESPPSISMSSQLSTPNKVVPYSFKSPGEKGAMREQCQKAWDVAFIMCGLPWTTANNPYFRAAIQMTRSCPDFKISCAKTMSSSRLEARNSEANRSKEARLKAGKEFGFLITSDGWRSVAKRNYHNYILVSIEGPIYLDLVETTGHSGSGQNIADGFEAQFRALGPDVVENIVLGVTDTPSANRKAWRLLEANYPKQTWIGCAAHEVSLLFKEWVKKTPDILRLFHEGHRVVKWVNNHAEILKLFRGIVPSHFTDKRKHCIGLYNPGDTRMATVFKMLFRVQLLLPVLIHLVSLPEYEVASQKALQAWSAQQPPEKKLTAINGKYVDMVKHFIQSPRFAEEISNFIKALKSAMYLLRLVDGQTPVIGKFYYACALVDKHLRVLKEQNAVPYIDQLRTIFMKRWKRWHRPVHTLAYALDPCYQTHELSRKEKADCTQVR